MIHEPFLWYNLGHRLNAMLYAQNATEDMYRLGQGTKKDYSEAIRWYQTLGIRRVEALLAMSFWPRKSGWIAFITVIRVRRGKKIYICESMMCLYVFQMWIYHLSVYKCLYDVIPSFSLSAGDVKPVVCVVCAVNGKSPRRLTPSTNRSIIPLFSPLNHITPYKKPQFHKI